MTNQTIREYKTEIMKISRNCGCVCDGCITGTGTHCLTPPCRRKKNRRTDAEIAAAGRYRNGRVRDQRWNPDPSRDGIRPRTPEEIDATTGRYPNGRAKPNRGSWKPRSEYPRNTRNGNEASVQAQVKHDPLAVKPKWFVKAQRNDTKVMLAAPRGRDEAYGMAGHLFMFGWRVKVIEP